MGTGKLASDIWDFGVRHYHMGEGKSRACIVLFSMAMSDPKFSSRCLTPNPIIKFAND